MENCNLEERNPYAPHTFRREPSQHYPDRILVNDRSGQLTDFTKCSRTLRHQLLVETAWDVPDHLGNGRFLKVELGNGLRVAFGDFRLKSRLWEEIYDSMPGVTLLACMKGCLKNQNDCFRKGFDLAAGTGALYFSPSPVMVRQVGPVENLQKLVIKIPLKLIDRLIDCRQLERAVCRENPFLVNRQLSDGMQATILQMFNCPFQGSSRRLYLEAKTLELIAHWMCGDAKEEPLSYPLKPDDSERIWRARDLLLQDLRNPPSLMVLSKNVGITHTRLNDGFKKTFGHTVFDWLRIQRLEKARLLVMEGRKNMTEIAYEIGFASSSHFTFAFRRYFGTPPSRYR